MKDIYGNPIADIEAATTRKRKFPEWCQANQLPVVLSEDQVRYISNRDLLAYILRDPNKADKLTYAYDDITEIGLATLNDIKQAGDLTEREAQIINIAFELGRRLVACNTSPKIRISDPESVYQAVKAHFIGVQQEELHLLTLNNKNEVIRRHLVHRGALNASICSPHTIFRLALSDNAAAIVLAHNHPSGNPTPSSDDITVTKALIIASKAIQITLLDHIIIGETGYISLKEQGAI